ncbi:hypothetical protein ACF07T_35930 [Streptomyces sp. NPDC015184]|uniref:hypothetical protein n=1 Tax=Streptomyces sp. NPDC015184 TaxID=3364946 RepID=UPI0036FE50EE
MNAAGTRVGAPSGRWSRLITLHGARVHAVHPRHGNICVNDTVNAYVADGRSPSRDLTRQR